MGGRVKTLHPKVHGGLLARSGIDEAAAAEHDIGLIDLVAVNLYPFTQVTARADCTLSEAIETIDIGGPAMLRAASKNHQRVTVLVDPADYEPVLASLRAGRDDEALRRVLATKAFAHTATYDAAISSYLATVGNAALPQMFAVAAERRQELRYGENPHQRAASYSIGTSAPGTVIDSRQLQGKALSYNNISDADAAVQCVKGFDAPTCVIVKHANPCGVASAADVLAAYSAAYDCDSTSAFGGIIAFNRPLDAETARAIIGRQFAEVIAAPEITSGAAAVLSEKPNIRVLALGPLSAPQSALEVKTIEAGLLVQSRDLGSWLDCATKVVTEREPSAEEWRDLEFAWTVAKHVKSNAIVYAREHRTVGIGAGQMSRVDSARIAALKAADAQLALEGAVMASDAFFPFRDAIDTAAERGIGAIVQPGGALRDDEIIIAADELGLAMVFTGMRHFRH
jgi:phosphoribosylaminoimidazolecarboxamide formyltransferase/IMP cyclohydrolase